jgi:periplasmic copper chaperone A
MSLKSILFAGALVALPTLATAHVVIEDAYARASSAMAQSGAVFMSIYNHNDFPDVLIGAESDVAERLELHTHIQTSDGVMRMVEVEGGIPLGADETVLLERGGLHVMLLGLTRPLEDGDTFTLRLIFETSDPVEIVVPVDLQRMPGQDGGMQHDHTHGHNHGG